MTLGVTTPTSCLGPATIVAGLSYYAGQVAP